MIKIIYFICTVCDLLIVLFFAAVGWLCHGEAITARLRAARVWTARMPDRIVYGILDALERERKGYDD